MHIYLLFVYNIHQYTPYKTYRRPPRPIAYIIIQTRLPPKYDVIAAAAGHVIVQDPATLPISNYDGKTSNCIT